MRATSKFGACVNIERKMTGEGSDGRFQRENGQGKIAVFTSIMNSSQKREFRGKLDVMSPLQLSDNSFQVFSFPWTNKNLFS